MTLEAVTHQFAGVVRKRRGASVCLCGEAGIGKSYTALEVLRSAPCHHLIVPATLRAAELIRLLPLPARLPAWSQRALESILAGAALPVASLVEAVMALLSGQTPFMLVVEDLHEAGAGETEFWQGLAASVARSKGTGLLATTRGTAPAGFGGITLAARTPEQTTALLQAELGGPLPQAALGWIQARTAGNPLYVLEHARFLARLGFLWSDGRRWRWRLPPDDLVPSTLEAVIEHELRTVAQSPEVRAVLAAFSVLEAHRQVQVPLLAQVARLDEATVVRALAILEGARMVRGEGFRHPLYREVVAHSQGQARRQDLAGRAFDALRAHDPLAATRFLDQARVSTEQALDVLDRALSAAKADQNALLTARLQAQATHFTAGERCGRLAQEAALGLRRTDLKGALSLAELAVRECPGDPEPVYLLAELLASQGRMQDAERALEHLGTEARSGPGWPQRLLTLRAGARDYSGVLELWWAHPALRERPSAELACHVGWALLHASDTRQARALAEQTETRGLAPEPLADVRQLQAAVDHYDGNIGRAAEQYLEAITLFREVGGAEKLVYALRGRANALMLLGHYAEARADLTAALEAGVQRGDASDVSLTQVSLGALLTDLGEYQAAEDLLSEALGTLERLDPGLILSQCYESLFWLYRAWNPPLGRVLALKYAEAALDLARSLRQDRLTAQGLAILGAAQANNDDVQQAWSPLLGALDLARRLNEPERICVILGLYGGALGVDARPAEAIAAYQEAHDLAATHGLAVEEHRAGLELARLLSDHHAQQAHLSWFGERGLAVPGEPGPGPTPPQALAPQPGLRLDVLGAMRVVNGSESLAVRGGKRQELLAVLLEARLAGREETTRPELFDALWPGDDEEHAASSLKSLVHSVRGAFGVQLVATTTGGYALGQVGSDAQAFMLDHDARWWRGPYLEGLEIRDEQAREGVYAALLASTRRLLTDESASAEPASTELANTGTAGAHAEAVRTSRLLIRADPYDLGALSIHLGALRASGNRRSLDRAYAEAQRRMLEVGERLPADWSAFLDPRTSA